MRFVKTTALCSLESELAHPTTAMLGHHRHPTIAEVPSQVSSRPQVTQEDREAEEGSLYFEGVTLMAA